MSARTLWAVSPDDHRAHAVTGPGQEGKLTAWCGHTMAPPTAGLDEVPRAQLCPSCAVAVAPDFADRCELVNAARDAEGLGPLVEP